MNEEKLMRNRIRPRNDKKGSNFLTITTYNIIVKSQGFSTKYCASIFKNT